MLPLPRSRLFRSVGLLAALLFSLSGFTPTRLFAQAPPPASARTPTKVWVNTSSGVYHCPGSRYYGATKAGTFLTEAQARSRSYRPAYGRICAPALATVDSTPPQLQPLEAGSRVWVNTTSGVYHCPGTRYFGTTKRGQYMSEAQARSKGYRPAYGNPCS